MIHYIRSTILPSKPAQLLIQSGSKWNQDHCPNIAAALAYYALFSLFPLLLVLLSIIGLLVEPSTELYQSILVTVERYLPPEVHELVEGTLMNLSASSTGAGIIGFSLLLVTASVFFTNLRNAVNLIWRSPKRTTETGSIGQRLLFSIANQFFSVLLVLGNALLLLISLFSNIFIHFILQLITALQGTSLIQIDELHLTKPLQFSSSFLILAIAGCILFKILPLVYVGWGDVWLSALVTALVLTGLQYLVSNSVITIGSRFLSYGAIGSVMILMVWIYLTCQIFLFGCVLSYVYAHLFGTRRGRAMEKLG
ncbi:YihY/virulence factor BrkB family protein [Leptolyngbyaceae cyanobacterium UHCC 1019]